MAKRQQGTDGSRSGNAYRALFEACRDGVIVVDRSLAITDLNSAGLALLGATSDASLLGTPLLDLLDTPQAPLRAACDLALKGKPAGTGVEILIDAPDRQKRTIEVRVEAVRVGRGLPSRLLVIARDVSAERAAHAEVAAVHDAHCALLAQGAQMAWTATADGKITPQAEPGASGFADRHALTPHDQGAQAIHPADLGALEEGWRRALVTGNPLCAEFRARGQDGSYRWQRARAIARRDEGGRIVGWHGATEDISDQKSLAHRLHISETFNRHMIESGAHAIQLLDASGRILSCNRQGLEALGIESFAAISGREWSNLWEPGAGDRAQRAIEDAKVQGIGEFSTFVGGDDPAASRWSRTIVSPVRDALGELTGFVAVTRDKAAQKAADDRTRWLATHDELTGLPKRVLFQEALARAIPRADEEGTSVAIILLDVDRFKEINDSLGHDAGDLVLRAVGSRLGSLGAPVEIAARLGGDEFALLLTNVGDRTDVANVADALIASLHDPVDHPARTLQCRGSFGVALYPKDGASPTELLKAADTALYVAKAMGRGGYAFFNSAMQRSMNKRIAVAERVRQALPAGVVAHYQPKVELATGGLAGFEALLRLKGEHGLLVPQSFATAFENVELALRMGEAMLEAVLDDIAAWLDADIDFGRVALNASAAELRRGDYASRVLQGLRLRGINPRLLEIEFAEGVFFGRDVEAVDDALRELALNGVGITLDDFGTGFASLSHLKRYPVDTLKIDQSFVHGLTQSTGDAAIVSAVCAMAKSLGLGIVAEGVETGQQAELLAAEGCHIAQGHLFGAAGDADMVPALVARRNVQGSLQGLFMPKPKRPLLRVVS